MSKQNRKKCYVITVSETFPKSHSKAGEPTGFVGKIDTKIKIHTIRKNYEWWKKRFDKIEKDEAYLSIRVWVGKPYGKGSTQKEVFQLHKADGIGIEKAISNVLDGFEINDFLVTDWTLAKNDGLPLLDFNLWFKDVEPLQELAIIHFTNFRYNEQN